MSAFWTNRSLRAVKNFLRCELWDRRSLRRRNFEHELHISIVMPLDLYFLRDNTRLSMVRPDCVAPRRDSIDDEIAVLIGHGKEGMIEYRNIGEFPGMNL